jgi:uncharacterized protein (TIGR03382 family)
VMVRDAWWDSGDVPGLADAIRSGGGYEGADEYMPVDCDRFELPGNPDDTSRPPNVSSTPALPIGRLDPASRNIVATGGTRLHIERWTAERKIFHAESAVPVTLALRLLYYPAWEIRVDGKAARADARPTTAQLLLPLSPGGHRVEVRFRRTWDRTAGNAVSALTAVALLAFWWVVRRRRRAL